jgi:hypothetical protein
MANQAVMEKALHQFFDLIWGSMEGNAILGLRDRPGPRGKVNRFTDFAYPQDIDQIVSWCIDHRNEDVYASPLMYGEERVPDKNPETGEANWNAGAVRRTPENALTSLTIYQDSDTCAPENFRLRPSIHVQSSTGRYQDYWVLTNPVSAQEAANVSHRIAIAHRDQGSDPSSWSANKVLRVPLTTNTTHGFPEDVLVGFSGDIYDYLDVSGCYDDIDLEERPILRLPADVSYDDVQDLPEYSESLDKLPNGFDLSMLTKEVPSGVDRSAMRYRLLCDLFRAGTLEFEDVLSLSWHAPSARKWREDPRNLRGLIAEALKAQAEVAYESGEGISPAELPKEDQYLKPLLTDDERACIAGDDNWLKRWDEWNRAKLGRAYNGPYVRMNGLSILSAAFSDTVFIPLANGEEPTGLYIMGVGDSGSGKSSHKKLYMQAMKEIFEDPGWRLGSNASPNALHEALIERDRKVTILDADEAHGWFSQLTAGAQSWTAGTLENLALYYDGDVPPMRRTGNRDLSGKSATTYFGVHLMGTKKGKLSITNVLSEDMIFSGFLARFIWYIGEDKEFTEDSMEVNMTTGDYVLMGYEPMCRQWAAEFANTKKLLKIKFKNRSRIGIPWDREAVARIGKLKWDVDRMFRGRHPKWELLEPSLRRIGSNAMRVAALLAAEENSDTVTIRHVLIAVEMAEEWVRNMVTMTEGLSASDWKRACDQIASFIAGKNGRARREVVLRRFSDRKGRELGEQINDLIQQGVLREESDEKRAKWLVLKAE